MPGAASFAPGPSTATPRAQHAVVALDGIVYAFGGVVSTTMQTGTLEALVGGSWKMRTGTVSVHAGVAATALDGEIYVGDSDDTWVYTAATDSWLVQYTPDTPRDHIAVATGSDHTVYEFGGEHNGSYALDLVDGWQPATVTWTARSPMSMPRRDPAAVAAPDGRMYLIGGEVSSATDTNSVESYTPQRDHWVVIAPLTSKRTAACAALGFDGRVYAIGGGDPTTPLRSIEVYGPHVTLVRATAGVGATVTVTGDNFAATAAVSVSLDGTPIASGVTDDNGHIVTDFLVPDTVSGAHRIVAIDSKSQYPTTVTLSIP
jgi:hypothetical protein